MADRILRTARWPRGAKPKAGFGRVVDLHSHVLPGIDDGPATMAESVALVRRLESEGVRTIAATPHLRADHPRVQPVELAALCAELAAHVARERVGVRIVPAGEVDLIWTLDARPEELKLVSYGQRGTDLLLECPYGLIPDFFEEQIFQLAVRGYRVLLAHPERNPTFQADPERLRALVERGVLVQLTAASIAGEPRSSRSARAARDFLTAGIAHIIASDSHGRAAPGRESLRPGLDAARALVGPRSDWMVRGAPEAVLAGQPLPGAPAPQPQQRWRRRRS